MKKVGGLKTSNGPPHTTVRISSHEVQGPHGEKTPRKLKDSTCWENACREVLGVHWIAVGMSSLVAVSFLFLSLVMCKVFGTVCSLAELVQCPPLTPTLDLGRFSTINHLIKLKIPTWSLEFLPSVTFPKRKGRRFWWLFVFWHLLICYLAIFLSDFPP